MPMPHFGNVVRAGPVGCASRSSHTVRCVREARGDVLLRLPPLAPLASDLATRTPFCNTYLAGAGWVQCDTWTADTCGQCSVPTLPLYPNHDPSQVQLCPWLSITRSTTSSQDAEPRAPGDQVRRLGPLVFAAAVAVRAHLARVRVRVGTALHASKSNHSPGASRRCRCRNG